MLKIKVNRKIISSIIIVIFLLSALIYNLLYMNNKKNDIIEEIEENEYIEVIEEEIKTIFVDVGGEVISPGLYELPENSRINDAISIAGGVTSDADLTTVNLAYILSDAMKIIIPKKEIKKTVTNTVKKQSPQVVTTNITVNENEENNGMVNINTATFDELKKLTGIGDSTAQKIIDYRNENGAFKSKEDIKNVSGIGESKYNSIKNNICV